MKNQFFTLAITLLLSSASYASDPQGVGGVRLLPRSAVETSAYSASGWQSNTNPPSKGVVRDEIELIQTPAPVNLGSGTAFVLDPDPRYRSAYGTATGNFTFSLGTNSVAAGTEVRLRVAIYDAAGGKTASVSASGTGGAAFASPDFCPNWGPTKAGTNVFTFLWSGGVWHADQDTAQLSPSQLNFAATQRVSGRNTAGAGAGEEVTLSQLLDWIGTAAQGDIIYRDAAGWGRLAAGTSGNFLQTQGAAANPVWSAVSTAPSLSTFQKYISVNCDFLAFDTTTGDTMAVRWALSPNAGGTLTSTGDGNNPGQAQLTISVTGSSFYTAARLDKTIRLGSGTVDWEINQKVSALSDGTDTYILRIGSIDTRPDTDSVDGVYFRYTSTANSGNWVGVVRNGSVESVANSAVAPSTSSFQKLRISVDATAANVHFYINGTEIAGSPVATNIPKTAGHEVAFGGFGITRTGGTSNARSLFVDYYNFLEVLTSSR